MRGVTVRLGTGKRLVLEGRRAPCYGAFIPMAVGSCWKIHTVRFAFLQGHCSCLVETGQKGTGMPGGRAISLGVRSPGSDAGEKQTHVGVCSLKMCKIEVV